MDAIKQLSTKGILRRTQYKDLVQIYYNRTFDHKDVTLEVYESTDDRWFVVYIGDFIGWTRDAEVAFRIRNSCPVFLLRELLEAANT